MRSVRMAHWMVCDRYGDERGALLGRDDSLLLQHCRKIWKSSTKGITEAFGLGYPDDLLYPWTCLA